MKKLVKQEMKAVVGGGPTNRTKWQCSYGGSSYFICPDYNPEIDDCDGGFATCFNTGIRCSIITCA